MPLVSVIITVYNVEKYIRRCIESIQKQTIKDIEIIVVDDGTPDNSINIVEEIAKSDKRVIIIRHEKNMGLMWARKTGYMAANGDYITFCDSDDYLPENALESLYNKAIYSGADIVSGNITFINTSGTQKKWQNSLAYGCDSHAVMMSLLKDEFSHNLCSKLFRKSLLQDYEYQTFENATNGEDGCLFYQVLCNAKKTFQIDEQVYYYMQNTSSSSQVRYNDRAIRSICILNRIRHQSSVVYSDLDDLRKKRITGILFGLYSQGYAFDARLNESIREQNLGKYLKLSPQIFSFAEIIRLFVQRYVQGPIWYLKAKIVKKLVIG